MVRDNREAETEMERRRRRRKAEKLRGLKRRRRRLVLAILAVLFLPIIGARIYFGVNPVILKNSVIDVELKDSVNLKKNIRYVFAGKASQVKITGSVDNVDRDARDLDPQPTLLWLNTALPLLCSSPSLIRRAPPPFSTFLHPGTTDERGLCFKHARKRDNVFRYIFLCPRLSGKPVSSSPLVFRPKATIPCPMLTPLFFSIGLDKCIAQSYN